MRMRLACGICLGVILGLGGSPAGAHGATAGDRPLTPIAFKLKHRSPAEIVALLARSDMPSGSAPRGARAGNAGALLPEGVDGVLRGPDPHSLLIVGNGSLAAVESCLEVLDVPLAPTGGGDFRVTLNLRNAGARSLQALVRREPGRGDAAARGRTLTLQGSAAWLHRALRRVAQAELGLTPERLSPTP